MKSYRYAEVEAPERHTSLTTNAQVVNVVVYDHVLTDAETQAHLAAFGYLLVDAGPDGLAVGDRFAGQAWVRNVDGVETVLPIEQPSRAVDAVLAMLQGVLPQGEDVGAGQVAQIEQMRVALDIVAADVAREGNEDTAIQSMVLFREWEPGDYREKVGEPRRFNGYPYRVYQPHDSTANPGWTPEAAPALWAPYHGTTAETALPYRQPTGTHDMYKAGEMMVWTDGTVYRCAQDTVYSPDTYAQAWARVTAGGTEEPETPVTPTYPAWVQPTGGHDAYKVGDRVTHQGKVWESTANGNVWVPGVYGWVVVAG